MSEGAERSETFEPEFRLLSAAHGGRNVDGGGSGLANGMVGRRRSLRTGDGLDAGAITQRPDLAFVVIQFQAGIDEQLVAFLAAIEFLNYRRKRRRDSGDERLARDLAARLQDRSFRGGRLQPVIENNSTPRFRKILWVNMASVSDIPAEYDRPPERLRSDAVRGADEGNSA